MALLSWHPSQAGLLPARAPGFHSFQCCSPAGRAPAEVLGLSLWINLGHWLVPEQIAAVEKEGTHQPGQGDRHPWAAKPRGSGVGEEASFFSFFNEANLNSFIFIF